MQAAFGQSLRQSGAASCGCGHHERRRLISQLELQLQQQVEERALFTIEWELA